MIDSGSLVTDFEAAGAVQAHIDDATDPHAAAGYLKSVQGDAAPILGGNLQTKGNEIQLTRLDDSIHGALDVSETEDLATLAYTNDGAYAAGDGAFVVRPGVAEVDGTSAIVASLQHAAVSGEVVYSTSNGTLYSVPPNTPAWEATATDSLNHDLGQGVGAGTWTVITNLAMNPVQAIANGDRIDFTYELYVANKSQVFLGDVEVGIGINAAQPLAQDIIGVNAISRGMVGYIAGAGIVTAAANYTGADTFTVYARINNGNNAGYGVDVLGLINSNSSSMSVQGVAGGVTTAVMNTTSAYALSGAVSNGDALQFFVDEDTGGGGQIIEVVGCSAVLTSGTCSITVDVGGTPVPGLDTPLAVSSTPAKFSATGNGVRPGGNTIPINITVSAAATPVDLQVSIFLRNTITLT